MRFRTVLTKIGATFALIALGLSSPLVAEAEVGGVEQSYHGQLGFGSGSGMLEKWCALPNFSFEQQSEIDGWTSQSCNGCHIGAAWNPTKSSSNCLYCHNSDSPKHWDVPQVADCMTCHSKDETKRGDAFTAEQDVHIAAGFLCQECHERKADEFSDHQFRKGTSIDTTEPTMEGTLSCTKFCHDPKPHSAKKGIAVKLNRHTEKVACETCHTGLRPAAALARRQWNVFVSGKPVTTMRAAGWLPEHKWYDNTGPGASGNYDLPILGYTERRDAEGAKIYPFNSVSVDWYIKTPTSKFDEVIPVPAVKAADSNGDGIVTLEEMQVTYPEATLVTEEMNFNISHSVVPVALAFGCKDCHGRNGWVLDWQQLGYEGDARRLKATGKGNGKGGK